jgi:pimeloyl-ACP methyl ester carboxylesterase
MAALITAIGDGPIAVMGHDWGAAVAYGLAMFHPHLVAQLIVVNGVHPVPFQTALAQGGAQAEASQYMEYLRRPDSHDILAADDFAGLMALFSAKMDTSWLSGARLDAYRAAWRNTESNNGGHDGGHDGGRLKTMTHWYRASPMRIAKPGQPITDLPEFPRDALTVHCPHLLIWADGDTALLPETHMGLEQFVPDLTRVAIADADHWVIHQKPNDVANAVLGWMSGF